MPLAGESLPGVGNMKRALRMSLAAGADLTPLFHFWGVHELAPPLDAAALNASMRSYGLGPSPKVRCLLLRYKVRVPADNVAFNAFFEQIYPGRPIVTSDSPLYGRGWFNAWRSAYNTSHGTAARARVDTILALYFGADTSSCAGVDSGGPGIDVVRPSSYRWLQDYYNLTAPSSPPTPPAPTVCSLSPSQLSLQCKCSFVWPEGASDGDEPSSTVLVCL